MNNEAPSKTNLSARFRPVFDRIAAGAVERETHRQLAFEAVDWLRAAGFGAVRVPLEYGGLGATREQLFDLIIELAEADSNISQALRAHFGFVERVLMEFSPQLKAHWFKLVVDGAIFGNATTEIGNVQVGTWSTRLYKEDGRWYLDGEKYYSTGALYSNWIGVTAQAEGRSPDVRTVVLVSSTAPGVELIDDWTGFGQRLTASGTTRFRRVVVDEAQIIDLPFVGATSMTAFLQLVHLATLAGISRAILRDAVGFIRERKRVFSHGSGETPARDPLVQQIVGQLSAAEFAATASVREVARALDDLDDVSSGSVEEDAHHIDRVELLSSKAQVVVSNLVLNAATTLFEGGGASALQESLRLDRHWRNARTVASHNPVIYKARAIGDHLLNGVAPTYYWTTGTRGQDGKAADK